MVHWKTYFASLDLRYTCVALLLFGSFCNPVPAFGLASCFEVDGRTIADLSVGACILSLFGDFLDGNILGRHESFWRSDCGGRYRFWVRMARSGSSLKLV